MKARIRFLPAMGGLVCLVGWTAGDLRLPAQTAEPPSTPQAEESKTREITLEDRADIFMARKSYLDAVDYYRRALKQSDFKNPSIWNKLGISYQQQANHREARKAYNQAIRRKKDFAEPWNNLGTTYYLENKFRKSLKYYQRAIQLNPNSAPFHLNIGSSYYGMKKYKEAVQEYHTSLSLDPNVLTERSPLGTVVQARGTDPQFYFYLAKVFAALGRAEEAVRYLRRAFEDGFKEQKRVTEDEDFQKISQHPAYIELMNSPPVAIKP
jgi:tetratricopeptide (TPR) repeat protein